MNMSTSTDSSGGAAPSSVTMTANKAWTAAGLSAVLAFLSSIATALGGAATGFDTITAGQWVTAGSPPSLPLLLPLAVRPG